MLESLAKSMPQITIDSVDEIIQFELTRACERIKKRLAALVTCNTSDFNINDCMIDSVLFVGYLSESFWYDEPTALPLDFINIARMNSNLEKLPETFS